MRAIPCRRPTTGIGWPRSAAVSRSDAIGRVAPLAATVAPGFGDGAVAEHEDAVVRLLVELVGDGRRTLLVAPWRHDGHPDHEAAGRATAAAAARTGGALLEYPVWFWHWAAPENAPWPDLVHLELDAPQQARKQQAIAAHRSQVAALTDRPGDEVLLTPAFLEHFAGRREVFVRQAPVDGVLDDLHAHDQDPWGVDRRWYELRKRRLLAAMLPRERFAAPWRSGARPGRSPTSWPPGATSSSRSTAAPTPWRPRDVGWPGSATCRSSSGRSRQWWPAGAFDLVVVSEVGYFLSPRDLDRLVDRIATTLADDGVVVLCHWRHPVAGWPLDGADVHARFRAPALRPVLAEYRDRDVEILVLAHADQAPDPGS